MQCLVVDDESLARDLIEAHLSQLTGYELVASCASAIEACDVLKNKHVDLMFLDIEMPVLKGTDFYKNLANKPKVIFTTAYRDYALDGFDLDAVDYLLKPIVFSRFFQAIERFATIHSQTSARINNPTNMIDNKQSDDNKHASVMPVGHIFVREDRKQVKVMLSEVLYIHSIKDYVKIVMESGSHLVKQRISVCEQELGSTFIRVHRSYIVNLNRVTAFTKHDVEIGDHEIPIGDNYRSSFEAQIKGEDRNSGG